MLGLPRVVALVAGFTAHTAAAPSAGSDRLASRGRRSEAAGRTRVKGRQSAVSAERRALSLAGRCGPADAAAMAPRTSTLALLFACASALAGSAQAPDPSLRRVRALDPALLQHVHEGLHRSATFRHIVAALEQSNVIVYLAPGVCDVGRIDGCLLRFVHVSGNTRYLRIVISRRVGAERAISVIGHELQHAREVAAAPTVVDGAGLVAMFRQASLRECKGVRGECYETQAAIDAEDAILKELGRQHHYVRR
jgi:hypothetical protein